MSIEIEKYKENYSEEKFWEKLKKIAKKIGVKATAYGLTLFYVLQKDEVTYRYKLFIIGCLGYFILPIDLVPDVLVGIGYTDDIGFMAINLIRISKYIDDDVKRKVSKKLSGWFDVKDGDVDEILEEKTEETFEEK